MALEEAGELEEAARVFEHAGEHAQAALLRLEHARTLRDPGERLDVLREGCARNPGATPEGCTLHLALAEALLDEVVSTEDAARTRALQLEAARALDEAGEAARAGELYEELGLLRNAAAAYERGGEIARLELILEVLERQSERRQQQRDVLRDVDEAIATGRRRFAQTLLTEHVHRGAPPTPGLPALPSSSAPPAAAYTPPAALVARLGLLEDKLITRERVDLGWGNGRSTAVHMGDRLRIGRSPSAELSLPGGRLSREHVELRIDHHGTRPRLVATDLGSRVGTFWEGEALAPGVVTALDQPGELALGMTSALEVVPVHGSGGTVRGGLIRTQDADGWLLFLPAGGPLWLAPDIRVPARIFRDRGLVVFDLAPRVDAELANRRLGPGSNIEFMLGDRLCLVGAPLCIEVLA